MAYALLLALLLHVNVIIAVLLGIIGFGIMLGLGMVVERRRYAKAMRKREAARTGGK